MMPCATVALEAAPRVRSGSSNVHAGRGHAFDRQRATLNTARVLGIESRTGTVRAGLEADLFVVDGNPLDDYRVFFEPRLVISDGKVVIEGYGL